MARAFSSNNIVTDNFILKSLPPEEAEVLARKLQHVEMSQAAAIYEPDEHISHIYFPSTAMLSIIATSVEGYSAECGVVGWEGVAGIEALLGHPTSTNRYIVQLAGDGHRAHVGAILRQFWGGVDSKGLSWHASAKRWSR